MKNVLFWINCLFLLLNGITALGLLSSNDYEQEKYSSLETDYLYLSQDYNLLKLDYDSLFYDYDKLLKDKSDLEYNFDSLKHTLKLSHDSIIYYYYHYYQILDEYQQYINEK